MSTENEHAAAAGSGALPLATPVHQPAATAGAGTGAAAGDQPLTPEHYRQLELARSRRRAIDRAALVAAFNGWCAIGCGVLAVPLGLFFTEALIGGLVVAALGCVELIGRGMLRRLDRRGPVVLGWNQLTFFALLTAYSLWRIYEGVTRPAELAGAGLQLLDQFTVPGYTSEQLVTLFVIVVYSAVIAATAVVQGATALYYFSRLRTLDAYVAETPSWIVELDRRR